VYSRTNDVRRIASLPILILASSIAVADCPSGSQSVGGKRVPYSAQSSQLVPKVGECPSGWHASGLCLVINAVIAPTGVQS
jgi:hypothetical protein